MTNHYHLVIETSDGNLSKGMRQLNGVYTQASNHRHDRSGHLFQGRYKAILVDGDSYLFELTRYVVLNPSKYKNRNDAIVAAYATGVYSYQQIADFYGLHFTTVGKILRKARALQ